MKIWPATLNPQSDELLSSWLTRIAHNHCQKIYTFYRDFNGTNKRMWSSDIDSLAKAEYLAKLSIHTGISLERIENTTLPSYQGYLFLNKIKQGHTKWILSLGIKNSMIYRYGLMFCPGCLQRDNEHPYYRKKWRLALSVCCVDCGIWLHEKCPECNYPIWFIRIELGKKNTHPTKSIAHCSKCYFDLRQTKTTKANSNIINFQKSLYRYIDSGFTEDIQYSHLYFNGFYQIVRILNSEKNDPLQLKNKILNIIGVKYTYRKNYIFELFEQKEIEERIVILKMANYILNNWPNNFVNLCKENKIWISTLFMVNKDEEGIPFWYWKVVTEFLNKRVAYNNPILLERWRAQQKRKKLNT